MERTLFKPQEISRVSPLLAVYSILLVVMRFLTLVVIADKFGLTARADVLFIAQLIPIALFMQNRKAIMLAFVPVYTEYLVNEDEERLWDFTSQFTNLALLAGVLITVLYAAAAPWLMPLLTIGFSQAEQDLTIRFTQLLSPAMFLFMVFAVEESLLYSHKRFTTTSWPILLCGAGGLVGILLLTDRYGVFGYGYGLLAGTFLQVLVPLTLFWKYRKKFTLSLNLKDPGLIRVYKILIPVYLLSILVGLMHITNRTLATTLGPGCVSVFQYSGTLTWILPILLTNTILAPLFPIIAQKVVRKEIDSVIDMVRRGTQTLVFSVTPVVVAMIVLREPIIQLLFQRGKFSLEDASQTAHVLIFYAPFVLALSLNLLYTQVLINLGQIQTLVKVIFCLFVLNIGLCLGFMKFFGVGGLALSMSVVFFLLAGISFLMIQHRTGRMGSFHLLRAGCKVLAVSGLAAVPVGFLVPFIQGRWDPSGLFQRAAALSVEGGVYCILYGLLVWAFRMEEVRFLLEFMKTKKVAGGEKGSQLSMSVIGG
jgi:putative peptidoglycan lipid II flippase